MKKLIALVAIAAAPVLFAQEKTQSSAEIKKAQTQKVSDVKADAKSLKASTASAKTTDTKVKATTATATHSKGGSASDLRAAGATERKATTSRTKAATK